MLREHTAIVRQIATQLGEKAANTRHLIARIVEHLGIDRVQALLHQTLEIEAQGGLMLPDGSRRRTLGGVFFHLARQQMSPELRQTVFGLGRKRRKSSNKNQLVTDAAPVFEWTERLDIVRSLEAEVGKANTVKATLIGLPTDIETRPDYVVATIDERIGNISLPRGVPRPPDAPTVYRVYITTNHWKRVAQAAKNANDALIIEGLCAHDQQIGGIVVFATSVTSKLIEVQKREAKSH
jgi:hypothetical protein